jgi:hypothetical protein
MYGIADDAVGEPETWYALTIGVEANGTTRIPCGAAGAVELRPFELVWRSEVRAAGSAAAPWCRASSGRACAAAARSSARAEQAAAITVDNRMVSPPGMRTGLLPHPLGNT